MKHIRLFASFFALMMLLCAGASAEITITKRDINMNTALDKNVSNILVLLQDGGETDTMMIASINSRTGRSVMLRVNCDLTVDVPENGETRLADVYALGREEEPGSGCRARRQHAAGAEHRHVCRAGREQPAGACRCRGYREHGADGRGS